MYSFQAEILKHVCLDKATIFLRTRDFSSHMNLKGIWGSSRFSKKNTYLYRHLPHQFHGGIPTLRQLHVGHAGLELLCSVAGNDIEFLSFQPPPLEYWDYRCPPCLAR